MNLLQSLKILGSDWIKITYLYKPLYSIRFVFDSSSIQPDLSIPSNNGQLGNIVLFSPWEKWWVSILFYTTNQHKITGWKGICDR